MLDTNRTAAAMKMAWQQIENTVPEADFAASKRAWRICQRALGNQLAESMEPVPTGAEEAFDDTLREFDRDCGGEGR